MYLRGPLTLLAIVFSAFLPNSRPFGVTASAGNTSAHATGSSQHTIEPANAMQSMAPPVGVPLQSSKIAARKENKGMAAHKPETKEFKGVLVPGWNDRNPKSMARYNEIRAQSHETPEQSISSKSSLVEVPLHPNETAALKAKEDKDKQGKMELRALMPDLQRPPIDSHSVERLIMKNPLVKDAFQMLDTLDLPKEPSKETRKQLRFLFLMLSDDLNLYDEKLGKCIYIPDDSHTLSRLKSLAKYCVLTMVTVDAIVALPPFHELFCFPEHQTFPMTWFMREFINSESTAEEFEIIDQVFRKRMNRSDEIGPLAFNPTKRFSLGKNNEVVEENGSEITRTILVYCPEKWVMRKPSSPVAQSPSSLPPKKWTINSLSELVDLRPDLHLKMLDNPWDAASDLDATAIKLAEFLFTPIGQMVFPTVRLGSRFQVSVLGKAVSKYHHDDTESEGGMTSKHVLDKIQTWLYNYQP